MNFGYRQPLECFETEDKEVTLRLDRIIEVNRKQQDIRETGYLMEPGDTVIAYTFEEIIAKEDCLVSGWPVVPQYLEAGFTGRIKLELVNDSDDCYFLMFGDAICDLSWSH